MLHTSLLSLGERSCNPGAGIISQECSPPQPSCCYLLGRGRRDRQQNLLLFRDTSGSTLSREQVLDNSFCSGLEQGLAGEVWALVPPHTGQL